MREIEILVEPTELYKILKFEGLAASGGEAKAIIDAGEVQVNGKIEKRKRKKIFTGDTIGVRNEKLKIILK